MATDAAKDHRSISSIELISMAGFAFCIAWVFLSFFWLFCDFPVNAPLEVSDLSQFLVFGGMAAGYVGLALAGKKPAFNPFSSVVLGVAFLLAVCQPLAALMMLNGLFVPLAAVCVTNALAGLGASVLILSWLDILSRLQETSYGRFTGSSFVGGSALFFFAVAAPGNIQPLFAAIYVVVTIGLIIFCTRRADGNDERAPLEAVADPWVFTKEIEPSFFVFNIIFALDFLFLFNSGKDAVMWGLLATVPGALVPALFGAFKRPLSVTVMQRALLVVTVIGCVMLPFVSGAAQIVCACLVSAAWAAFMCANYAFIVMKSVHMRSVPLFRQGASRLSVPALGFAAGWIVGAAITFSAGAHAEAFTVLHLVMTVLLVITVMVFFPVGSHHPAGGGAAEEPRMEGPVLSIQMDESQLLDKKCEAIVALYQLSPREADILVFLAKGRNAAWIQEQLVISPHTVKSHIYNIYRKLDIHSQQKLMSFVEEYPLDLSS